MITELQQLESEYIGLLKTVWHNNRGDDPADRVRWVSDTKRLRALKKSWKVAEKIRRVMG